MNTHVAKAWTRFSNATVTTAVGACYSATDGQTDRRTLKCTCLDGRAAAETLQRSTLIWMCDQTLLWRYAVIYRPIVVTALSGVGYSEWNELNTLPDSVIAILFHDPCRRSLTGRRLTVGRSVLLAVTAPAVQWAAAFKRTWNIDIYFNANFNASSDIWDT